MECVLCQMWARMPYAKRYTTPTTAEQTQGAMIVGFWLSSRATSAPRICEGHLAVLNMLDQQEEHRIAAENQQRINAEQAAMAVQLPPAVQSQVNQLQQRQQAVLAGGPPIVQPPPPPTPIQAIVPNLNEVAPAAPVAQAPFKLGPGPLTNENTNTAPPPLPMTPDPTQPYHATPGTIEGALEAARMPAVEGAKVTYPCPSCGQEISTGDVHAC